VKPKARKRRRLGKLAQALLAISLALSFPATALGDSPTRDVSGSACAKDWGDDVEMREKCFQQEAFVARLIELYQFEMPPEWVRQAREICFRDWPNNPQMIYYCLTVRQRAALKGSEPK